MNNHKGFIEPVIDETHWILGGGNAPFTEIEPDGDWTEYLPSEEKQNIRGIETYNCTSFNTLNAIEVLMYRLFGERVNYSDRWLGIVAGTSAEQGGNDPHTVCEAIRKYGLIPEEMLPFSDEITTAKEYYSFKGGDEAACRQAGQDWLKKYDFKHEWVFRQSQPLDEKLNNMKVALKNSPLSMSVWAWQVDNRGVYVSAGAPNHWTSSYGFQNLIAKAFDSYEPFRKLVDQNYLYCKRYSIVKRTDEALSLIQTIILLVKKALGLIQEEIKDIPKDTVKDTVEEEYPRYQWDTIEHIRKSIRIICDEEGLTVAQKNMCCDIAACESGFNINAKLVNSVKSVDRGLFQWNSYWHPEITDEIAYNPEKNTRLACKAIKQGKSKVYWSASMKCWNKDGRYNSILAV